MSVVFYDWILETTATTGTGTLTLGGAVTGYRAFSAAVGTGRPVKYSVYDVDANGNPNGNFEVGYGVYTLSGTTLSRLAVIASSNAGALVNFTSGQCRVALVADSGENNALSLLLYGDGSDGDVTVSSGTTTLTRDMYYRNLTISGTGSIYTAGNRIFVSEVTDLTAAPNGAIYNSGFSGSGAVGQTGETGVAGGASSAVGGGVSGGAGANGTTGAGQAGVSSANAVANGGTGGAGGAGGSGSGGAGGAGAAAGTLTAYPVRKFQDQLIHGATLISGGGGGGGAGSGGGSGTGTGNGGGGGGGGGGVVFLSSRVVDRGASTASIAIQAIGGAGAGNASTNTNCGGGGGSGGGGGGWIYVCYNLLEGSTGTDIFDASGGAGGTGGNGNGTALGGTGGTGGAGGRITLIDLGTGTVTETVGSAGSAGSAASGNTGGAGGNGNTLIVSL